MRNVFSSVCLGIALFTLPVIGGKSGNWSISIEDSTFGCGIFNLPVTAPTSFYDKDGIVGPRVATAEVVTQGSKQDVSKIDLFSPGISNDVEVWVTDVVNGKDAWGNDATITFRVGDNGTDPKTWAASTDTHLKLGDLRLITRELEQRKNYPYSVTNTNQHALDDILTARFMDYVENMYQCVEWNTP
ncbi:hypothetical protein T439DRAFT_367115 [Meredithblackwellia eburnea MCA 4105]